MNPSLPDIGQALPLTRVLNRCPDPVALFVQATGGGLRRDTLLLESADSASGQGDKSLLAIRSALRITARDRVVEVKALSPNGRNLLPWLADCLRPTADVNLVADGLIARFPGMAQGDEVTRLKAPSPVDVLRCLMHRLEPLSDQPRCGPVAMGCFSYDLLGVFEHLPEAAADPLGWPDFEFVLPEQTIWIQHARRNTRIVCHVFGGDGVEKAYHDGIEALSRLVDMVESCAVESRTPGPARTCSPDAAAVSVDMDDADYGQMVRRCQEHILAGDVFQIVPSRTFSIPCPDPLAAYRALRRLNPSPYMFLLNASSGVLFGASPETAVKVDGDPRRIQIRPIAGTRPRSRRADGEFDHDGDSRLETELRLNEKELAEHMMLVDLARNDVARVSRAGTRRVDKLMAVDRYSHVMHLVSYVGGELRDDLDGLHAYVASMNMGTLTGAPKLKAAELLRHFERTRRGPYGGAVGYASSDGDLDTCIVIRSALVRDGMALVRAGAGVVADSDPQAEADETRRKAQAVLQAIVEAGVAS